MKKIFTLIIVIVILHACGTKDQEQLITVDKKYSLSLPSFLTKTNNLNDDASLQYMNAWREFYVIVIDEPKEEYQRVLEENSLTDTYNNDIDSYSQLVLDSFKTSLINPTQTKVIDTIVNHMPSRFTTLKGEVEGINVFYIYGLYEGRENYYQVLIWTLPSKEEKNKQTMNKILYSFKELNNQKKY